MNQILLLCITILTCSALADALICRFCRKYVKGVGCKKGESTCEPKKGYHCNTVEISQEVRLGFVRKGCTKPVSPCGTTIMSEHGTVRTDCCDRDFCNDE